jgi:hypothetical protein
MDQSRVASLLLAGGLLACPSFAHPRGLPETSGSLVSVAVELEGRPIALYPAPDGSGRYYLEARPGVRYAVTLASRSGGRLGVVLAVDGLNVISGEREAGRGRMYVLDPWQSVTVRGWRTSLEEVRQFTFVDERASYAARSGKANEKMGWIEVAVFRERRPFVQATPLLRAPSGPLPDERPEHDGGAARGTAEDRAPAAGAPQAKAESNQAEAQALSGSARSYPGTGWGQRRHDPVVLVSFEPEQAPSQRVTLRYEYRAALVALGVLPRSIPWLDRLWQRDHADAGFAEPPRW